LAERYVADGANRALLSLGPELSSRKQSRCDALPEQLGALKKTLLEQELMRQKGSYKSTMTRFGSTAKKPFTTKMR